jgi:hypothetical protein
MVGTLYVLVPIFPWIASDASFPGPSRYVFHEAFFRSIREITLRGENYSR